jgi:sugar lactone lactonase YvrE
VQADGTLNTATSESAYDIANASYTQAFSVSAQDAIPKGVAFNPTGTKMFIAGGTANNVHEYDLSTGFDVSTASFVDSFSVNAQVIQIEGVTFNPTGTKMFVAGAYGAAIFEYDLSAGFDVSTAVYSQNFSVSAQDTGPTGVVFNSNGSKMFVVGKTNDAVYEYALSTGFDVSTASFTDSFSISSQETSPQGIAFNAEGTAMFIVGQTGDDVNEYTLATGFDVSTSSFTDSFSVAGQEISPSGLAFNPDGTKMFVVGYDGDDVNQYATTSTVTNSTTVLAGKALSSTSINLDYTT